MPWAAKAAHIRGLWRLWQAAGQVDPRFYFTEFAAAEDGPWLACASPHSERVYVYDVRDGSMAASVETGGWGQVDWVPRNGDGPEMLVVRSGQGLRAFRMVERGEALQGQQDAGAAVAAGRTGQRRNR